MELVRRLSVAKDNDEGPIEKLRAVDLDLVCEGVPRELSNVPFQVQNVKA